MPADQVFLDVSAFATVLRELHAQRTNRVNSSRKERVLRSTLTRAERGEVLGKTGGRCHICGGTIIANDWQADHVMAHSTGGKHAVENYLAAHSIGNNYRWYYDAEEFQWILKLGVWLRTQIEKGTPIGREAGQKFCENERWRAGRRKLPLEDR
jgi:5-methylcytosine-specific restriction endonuclease McrA